MGRDKKYRPGDAEDFLRYSGNEMSGEERNIFEKNLQKDIFEAEAADGLSSVSTDEAKKDLAELNQRLTGRTQQRNRFIFYRIAAAVAAIIVIGTIIIMVTGIGFFPGQVAVTETGEQKSRETISHEELPIQPDSEKPGIGKELSRINIPDDKQQENQLKTKSRDLATVHEVVEDKISHKIQEQTGKPEFTTIAVQNEPGIAGELKKIIGEEEINESAGMDETVEVAFRQKSAPSLSAMEARPAGEGIRQYGTLRTGSVRGTVISSEDNLPIPGTFVAVKGTSAGTITDHDGNFEIPLHDDSSHTLVIDFIGMERKEIELSDKEGVRITLEPSESTLDETVIIGHGLQPKSGTTGSVSAIGLDENIDYQPASPVTGYSEFREYIENNIQYPLQHPANLRKAVVLEFQIGGDGRPKNIFILKTPGKEYSEEAIRLLKNGPDWLPAKRDGIEIEETTRIRIVFKPDY